MHHWQKAVKEEVCVKIGIATRNMEAWSSTQVREALTRHGVSYVCFTFPKLIAQLGSKPYFKVKDVNQQEIDILKDLNALIIRPIGRGSLEELVFRMDMLYKLEREGFYVINPAEAIEHCVDKYDILSILEDNGVPVPRTFATESANEAVKAFAELGGDVVVKPIFGIKGHRRNPSQRRRNCPHNLQGNYFSTRCHIPPGIRATRHLRHTRVRCRRARYRRNA